MKKPVDYKTRPLGSMETKARNISNGKQGV